ncbi:MAG TPA: OsmC family protein [Candidatus Koribacter sp.]|jgi:putative redox protein
MQARVKLIEDDRLSAVASSKHAVVMDASEEKQASSPLEYCLMALCGCTASDVLAILRKKREPFTSLEVSAVAERAETYPKVFTKINLLYRVDGPVNRKSVEDAVRLSKEKYCSVSAMLAKTAEITTAIALTDEKK